MIGTARRGILAHGGNRSQQFNERGKRGAPGFMVGQFPVENPRSTGGDDTIHSGETTTLFELASFGNSQTVSAKAKQTRERREGVPALCPFGQDCCLAKVRLSLKS